MWWYLSIHSVLACVAASWRYRHPLKRNKWNSTCSAQQQCVFPEIMTRLINVIRGRCLWAVSCRNHFLFIEPSLLTVSKCRRKRASTELTSQVVSINLCKLWTPLMFTSCHEHETLIRALMLTPFCTVVGCDSVQRVLCLWQDVMQTLMMSSSAQLPSSIELHQEKTDISTADISATIEMDK